MYFNLESFILIAYWFQSLKLWEGTEGTGRTSKHPTHINPGLEPGTVTMPPWWLFCNLKKIYRLFNL